MERYRLSAPALSAVGVAIGGLGALAAALLASTSPGLAADVTFERLLNPEAGNWLTNNRTYDGHRYSPLDEINRETVGDLDLAFTLALAPSEPGATFASGLQGTPLVNDGIMYATDGWSRVYRIDLTVGDRGFINWIMDPATDREVDGIPGNRGVALLGSTVYSLTLDGLFVGTDAATGEVLFEVATEQNPREYFSIAPLAIDGQIIIATSGGDGPIRGRIESRNPEDGSLIWTRHTIPAPGEPGGETWGGNSYETGGVGIWVTGSFDPGENTLVYGTGNPSPFGDPTLRPGDNLYSSSSLALDAASGDVRWYFQYTPNEQWDYDEVGTQQLYTAEIDGQTRNLVGHFARNGFFYNIDARTGEFVNGAQYVEEVTWTAGIDPKTGLPVEYNPANRSGGIQRYAIDPYTSENPTVVCPNIQGGTNMFPTTYSPDSRLVYASAIEGCTNRGGSTDPRGDVQTGSVTAIDAATGQVVTKRSLPFVAYGGNVSTAGRLVFGSTIDGEFFALNDETLETLWSVNVGTPIEAAPITYEAGGKQYVAVYVGAAGVAMGFSRYPARGDDPNAVSLSNMQRTSMLYVFALD